MEHPVGQLDRVRRERLAILPTGLEQRAVPLLDGERCEFTQACRPEIRVDVAPHRLGVTHPRGQGYLGLDTLQPRVEELTQRRPCRGDERSTLEPGHRFVERGLGFLLGVEAAGLTLASFADVIETKIDAVAPRSALGSRLANTPTHAPIVNSFVRSGGQSVGREPLLEHRVSFRYGL
jgi:hypothetical protein